MAEKKNKKYDEKKDVLERAYPQTQELIEIKREKLQLERMKKELEITMMDPTNLDPKQQQCISQLCQEIIQPQEKNNW